MDKAARNNRANQLNPNNEKHQPNQASKDNRANQLNPNNEKYKGGGVFCSPRSATTRNMADAAPKYKLIYFNAPAKAEPLRWMFAYGGVPFEDFRIKERPQIVTGKPNPEWDELKQKLPFGVVPVLEVNGEYLGEGAAIARYLAPKCGLAGANEWETAQADGIVTFIENEFPFQVVREWIIATAQKNPEKAATMQKLMQPNLMKVAERLDGILQRKKTESGKSGFFVGKAPTIADLFAVSFFEWVEGYIKPGVLSVEFPLLVAHRELVRELPGIKEFLALHQP
ncbi:putative Hematopoietic prostaglandin D synthase [Hypsibius exemplaris]|uniref:glutathione transferase n=1 Tax=Hypsibius exemplaris TaxID=2072580 RepID=A0A1W0XCA3_HYPEX|nr:putative Hematopoietic prostaglandin D synthase [Hypsibius exemplaris]